MGTRTAVVVEVNLGLLIIIFNVTLFVYYNVHYIVNDNNIILLLQFQIMNLLNICR